MAYGTLLPNYQSFLNQDLYLELLHQYPELSIIPVNEPKYPTPLAWLTPQDDQIWINYLNHWIDIKKAQGFFDLMMNKYKLKSL